MLLLYSTTITARLRYICQFVFESQLGLSCRITDDFDSWSAYTGGKINYSAKTYNGKAYTIIPHPLLFEKNIHEQQTDCFSWEGHPAFFKIQDSDIPFDILAASFFLLSRYEEYLPYQPDLYFRFRHTQSLAFQQGFLNKPIINCWMITFGNQLMNTFQELKPAFQKFRIQITFDIDMAWAYRHKGLLRNIAGFLQKPGLERIKVLSGFQEDPFYNFKLLQTAIEKSELPVIYFFLVAAKRSLYDKNISPQQKSMQSLIRQCSNAAVVGLHPSWQTHEKSSLISSEKKMLEEVSGKRIIHSRQHYIRFQLPDDYEKLIAAGIQHDYSMGYGTVNGFRASVASTFLWYNLIKDETSTLQIHPFCFMDANSYFEQKQTAEETSSELNYYHEVCKAANGIFIPVFHNHLLSASEKMKPWVKLFQSFISQLPPAV